MTPDRLLIRNAVLVLPDRLLEGALMVERGRITELYLEPRNLPDASEALDLGGRYLAAGFIDLHIHGARGVDFMTAGVDGLKQMARFLLENGVTRFLPTTVPSPDPAYLQAIGAAAQLMRAQSPASGLSQVMGIHFEGPFVNPAQTGALNAHQLRTFKRTSDVEMFLAEPVREANGAVMMTVAPEIEGGLELIGALHRSGVITSIGHSRASFENCEAALQRGARHITHFPNALSPLHHRQPGVVGWGLLRDEVTVDLIADGAHVDENMVRLVHRNKTSARMGLVSDATLPCGLGDGEYQVWGERIEVRGGKTSNPAGQLAGSVITVRQAVSNLKRWGFPLTEISRMASYVPAEILGVSGELGSLSVGKRADLVGFDGDLRMAFTMVEGHVARPS